jgi:hypothetical protein
MIPAKGMRSMFIVVFPIAMIFVLSCSRAPEQDEPLLGLRQAEEGDPRVAVRNLVKRLLPHHDHTDDGAPRNVSRESSRLGNIVWMIFMYQEARTQFREY